MKTAMGFILVAGLLVSGVGRAEPAARPSLQAVVVAFLGQMDSTSRCVMTSYQGDGTPVGEGKGTCGHPGRNAEIAWRFVGHKENADVYEFSRRFPVEDFNAKTEKKTVAFSGARVVVFEDSEQVVVMQGLLVKKG